MNKRKYFIDIQYLYQFDGSFESARFTTLETGIREFENIKELKHYVKNSIRYNKKENEEWYRNITKHFDEIERPLYFYKDNDGEETRYICEKNGYCESFGIESIYRAFIYPITKKNAINFI